MSCGNVEKLLAGYIDRELDPADMHTVAAHLQSCPRCRTKMQAHSAVSASIRRHASYHPAPPGLVDRIRPESVPKAPEPRLDIPPRPTRRFEWAWRLRPAVAVATAMLATAIVSSTATLYVAGISGEEQLARELLTGHSRAVLTSHAIDVASSDQHTVKPWLSSKLDFSPKVPDLGPAGFPLRGGRIDYVDNRTVAVLVYARRQHVIDLFVWPENATRKNTQPGSFSRRGLNVVHWTAGDMTYWAVSDVNAADLDAFAEAYKRSL
jgi:anti-sigma factor RsiW